MSRTPLHLNISNTGCVAKNRKKRNGAVLQKENSSGRMGQKEKRMAMTGQPPFKWYCQLIERMEELSEKKDEGKKRSTRDRCLRG
jgi:hypothetical protein